MRFMVEFLPLARRRSTPGTTLVAAAPTDESTHSSIRWEDLLTDVGNRPLPHRVSGHTVGAMNGRERTATLAWFLVALLLACSAAGVGTSIALRHDTHSSAGDAVLSVAVVVVVVAARPSHRIGWLLLAGGAAWAVGNAGVDVAEHGAANPDSVPGVSAFALGGGVVRDVGWYAVILGLPILFPTGRVASPRWRWLTRALVVIMAASAVDTLVAPGANLMIHGWDNPLELSGWLSFVDPVAFMLSLPLALVVAVGALFELRDRWRRGAELERQQLLLFAMAAGLPVLAGPISFIPGAPDWVFSVAVLPLPVAVGFAVLARGLYDLRTAANRTVVWVVLSALVAGVYAAVIAALGGALDFGTAAWLPALAVGVVAVSFAPLRDALQRGVNRVLFGRWDEPYEVLARIGQRLEATGDVRRLLADAASELSALGLRHVRIEDAHGHVVASSPDADVAQPDVVDEIPLLVYGERVGTLRFESPATPLRPSDRRLLEDLAVHLGGVLHDHRLTGELQRALERVVLAREEERRRLRRDLHDGLGPALAGHLLRLDVIARELPPGSRALELVDALRDDIRATVMDVRRVVEGLRPPALDELGLAGAVEQAVHRIAADGHLRVEVQIAPLPPLPAATEVAAFRIVTEAVANVVRHARASMCRVALEASGGALRLCVEDDGIGLAAAASGGNGLHTMRERAEEMGGSLRVTTRDGTSVVAELPVPVALQEAAL
jgi:signal transduction histidine kinase